MGRWDGGQPGRGLAEGFLLETRLRRGSVGWLGWHGDQTWVLTGCSVLDLPHTPLGKSLIEGVG